jgi:hypothetical protein
VKLDCFCKILRDTGRLTDSLGSKQCGSPDAQSLFGNLVDVSEEPRLMDQVPIPVSLRLVRQTRPETYVDLPSSFSQTDHPSPTPEARPALVQGDMTVLTHPTEE